MPCQHPDPKTVSILSCVECGYFVDGVRVGDASPATMREVVLTSWREKRRPYTKPELVCYGKLMDVTEAVGMKGAIDGGAPPRGRTSA